jgi:hypothetical protein
MDRFWTLAGRVLLLALTALVVATFRDYGVTHDELVQHTYGEKLWDFYRSGFADRSAFEYFDLFRYGGLFDLAAVALVKVLPFSTYETRHLLSGLCGVLGIVGAGKLAELIGGRRAGFIALAMLALTASWFGSMFNDTKDIPFAAGMAWTLYFAARISLALPSPPLRLALAFGAVFGATFGIRVGVLMMPAYLAVVALLWSWREKRNVPHDILLLVRRLIPAAVLAYVLMALFWPWGVFEPLNPIRALAYFSHHPIEIDTRAFWVEIQSRETPWYYIPGYLLVKLPESTLLFFALGLAFLARPAALGGRLADRLPALMTVLAALVPLVLFILFRPTVFNGLRHFFFVVPPITVLAAVGLERVWRLAEARGPGLRAGFVAVVLLVSGWQAKTMADLHPNEYVYYNALVGGVAGAQKGFEMDYWSNSIREAAIKLTAFIAAETGGRPPARPYLVSLCSPHESFYEFVPDGWFTPAEGWAQGEFFVAPTQMDCHARMPGEVVVAVERAGALLSVVKDRRRLVTPVN